MTVANRLSADLLSGDNWLSADQTSKYNQLHITNQKVEFCDSVYLFSSCKIYHVYCFCFQSCFTLLYRYVVYIDAKMINIFGSKINKNEGLDNLIDINHVNAASSVGNLGKNQNQSYAYCDVTQVLGRHRIIEKAYTFWKEKIYTCETF